MNPLTISARGQLSLRKDVLQHLGVTPGDQLVYEKLPGRELRVRVAPRKQSINKFIGKFADRSSKVISIEEMNKAISDGWSDRKNSSKQR